MKGNFESVINDNRPVIVDFHAEWCAPCKVQSPVLEELARNLGDRIRVIKIDVDRNTELAARYGIQGVPSILIFKKGRLIHQQAGVHSKSQLMTILIQNMIQ